MADDRPKIKLQFASQKSLTITIGNGDYRRVFDVKDQPFECEPEEAAMLLKTGNFVKHVPPPEAEKAAPVNTGAAPTSASKRGERGKTAGTLGEPATEL